ncbi:MAG: fumarate hydratase, partial [Candidatus Puniceispirillales bacterium]
MTTFQYSPILPKTRPDCEWVHITSDYIEQVTWGGKSFLKVQPEALSLIAERAFKEISHFLRPSHLGQLRAILDDDDASHNDHFVALEMLKNAVIAADQILPMCQDTGTAIISGVRGDQVFVDGDDGEALARGVWQVYQTSNLRYSQVAPISMFDEVNTATNLPAQVDLYAGKGM